MESDFGHLNMEKVHLVGLLGVVLVLGSMFPVLKSDAANTPQQDNVSKRVQLPSSKFPDFDIRLVGKGEFLDENLVQASSKQAAERNAATQARASAVDAFRASLGQEKAGNLRGNG